MPVGRTLAEDLAQALADLYRGAERAITLDLARRLKTGIRGPDWVSEKLASINDLRNTVQRVLGRLAADTTGLAEQALTLAFARGGKAALDELGRSGGLDSTQLAAIRASVPGAEAINRLAYSLVSTLRGTHLPVLRWALDTYREVIATVALPGVLLGTTTRLAAAQHAWDRLISQGITGFVDRAGRHWELASYVEMAVRTGAAQAAVEGHLDRLGAAGVDLVVVSDHAGECERCRPWEGKVLSRTRGGKHTVEMEHATIDGRMVTVHVKGSVDEAVAGGFLHPNCRHTLSIYLSGITTIPTETADPEGDQARQKLRALERKVRREKLQAAAALSQLDASRHEARVRELQARIRAHVALSPNLRRQRHREQIGAAR